MVVYLIIITCLGWMWGQMAPILKKYNSVLIGNYIGEEAEQ